MSMTRDEMVEDMRRLTTILGLPPAPKEYWHDLPLEELIAVHTFTLNAVADRQTKKAQLLETNVLGIPHDVKLKYASQETMEQYVDTSTAFFKAVFQLDSDTMWLSDKSSLNDFWGTTIPDGLIDPDEQHWHTRVVAHINKIYPTVDLVDDDILFIDLFARIEKAKPLQ